MKRMGTATVCLLLVSLAGALGLVCTPVSSAQEGDPSDVWLRAYMVMREGEVKEEEKKDLEALSKYREAQRLFDFLARTHPTWKSNMVTFRRKALLDKIEEVHGRLKGTDPAAEMAMRSQNPGGAPVPALPGTRPGGITVPANAEAQAGGGPMTPAAPNYGGAPASLAGGMAAPVESINQEFSKLQAQLDQLSGANQRLMAERDQRQQAVSTLEGKLEQSRQIEQQLRTQLTKALDDLQAAQKSGGDRQRQLEEQLQLATKELRDANAASAGILKALETAKLEVAELNKAKGALLAEREGEMEKSAQLMSQLEQTTEDRDKARADRDAARAELKQNQELVAKLEAQIQSGDPALKTRNEELVAELKKSQETIVALNARVEDLEREKDGLQQANQQLKARQEELIKERDILRKERDEMAILLKAGDQIQGDVKDILEANGAWRKQLEEANRRTLELQEKEGNYQREIQDLRGQLSVMQQERDLLRTENDQYQKTVTELNGKLEKMLAELGQKTKALEELTSTLGGAANGPVVLAGKSYTKEELETLAGAREENELLRGIIREQLVQQARAHTARQLVLQELEKMDFQSELLLTSLDDMTGQQIDISEEVKKMFKGREEMQLIEVVETAQASEKKFASVKTGKETVPEYPESVAPVVEEGTAPKDLSPAAKQRHVTQLAKAANYDFSRADYKAARRGYEQILTYQPNDVVALANMGLIHARSGDRAKAKDYLEKALNYDQTHAPTHYYLGWLHFMQHDYDLAMDCFGKCLTHDRKNANAHHYLGLIAMEKGWVPRAESEFLQVVELEPKHANAHFNLAVLYVTKKPDKTLARKHYKLARDLGAAPDLDMEKLLASR